MILLALLALQLPPPARLPFEAPEPPARALPPTVVLSPTPIRHHKGTKRRHSPARNSIDKGFHYR
jgi:hypothetical protein